MAVNTGVRKTLRVLLVEDSEPDAELVLAALSDGGYHVVAHRVQTADEMRAALARDEWQLVLSDYSLPGFSAPAALAILHEQRPDLPFIIVSGTVGEDTAVTALKAGASDFLVKGRLARLVPAIERELREVDLRRARDRERDSLEERLRQSQKLEGIGRLAGGIAHDFNNLLTAIIGYTEMVLEQVGPDKPISKDLEEIRHASNRAVALTRQLLAFSRKQSLKIAAMDVNEIIGAMRGMLDRLISEDVQIRLKMTSGLPAILTDRIQMEQIVLNLVMNARDAMPHGGVVTIETMVVEANEVMAVAHGPVAPKRYVALRVIDTGIGMDAATQGHVFEPFFTTKGEGTGLGLATVYGVVQQLGGHIGVWSEVGRGTIFNLYFPEAANLTTAHLAMPHAASRAASGGHENVLVVEDERGVRHLVSRILRWNGYAVVEAVDAAQALELADNDQLNIDLVVSDVVMPAMAGPELIARLRVKRPDLKTLYISGYVGEELARRLYLDPTATLLEKPFTSSRLLAEVRRVIDA